MNGIPNFQIIFEPLFQLATYGFEVFSNTLADQLTHSMISSAEAQFQLFLMDEYIDISLAVLKHKLCSAFKVSTLQIAMISKCLKLIYGNFTS